MKKNFVQISEDLRLRPPQQNLWKICFYSRFTTIDNRWFNFPDIEWCALVLSTLNLIHILYSNLYYPSDEEKGK
jgi:hypothetical protein